MPLVTQQLSHQLMRAPFHSTPRAVADLGFHANSRFVTLGVYARELPRAVPRFGVIRNNPVAQAAGVPAPRLLTFPRQPVATTQDTSRGCYIVDMRWPNSPRVSLPPGRY